MLKKELLMMAGGTEVVGLTLTINWYPSLLEEQFIKVYRNDVLVYTVRPKETIEPVKVYPQDTIVLETDVSFVIKPNHASHISPLSGTRYIVNDVPCTLDIRIEWKG